MKMELSVRLLAALVAFTASFSSASPPPVAKPLHLVAKQADIIAIVDVGSATVADAASGARYEISSPTVLRGSLSGVCIAGPLGLKAGRRYVVFLQSLQDRENCGGVTIAGTVEPAAFELEQFQEAAYVRLDNRRIISPRFEDVVEMKQLLELDGEVSEIILGTIVPLATFTRYITQ